MNLPELKKSSRQREFNSYNQEIKDKVIYSYLFEGKSYRELDEELLRLNSDESRGWQAMGVLHYMGITGSFKALFKEVSVIEAINQFESMGDKYIEIIDSLKRYYERNINVPSAKLYNTWMIFANLKIYNLEGSFADRNYIYWRQGAKYSIGDIVFIYCTKPYMKVMFKTLVEKVNINFDEIRDDVRYYIQVNEYKNAKEGKYCRLRLIAKTDTIFLSLQQLLNYGLKEAPQGTISIKDELLDYIDSNFNDLNFEGFFSDLCEEEINEGIKKTVTVNRYERSSIARKKCIEYNGCYCHVCGMDFEIVYGHLGKDFIHVHHKKPLSEINDTYIVDYKNDLIPICPNCHAMLHRKLEGKDMTIKQLKRIFSYYNKLNK